MFMKNPSQSGFLTEVNGIRGSNLTKRGTDLVDRWFQNRKRHWGWGVLPRNKEKT
jgi:hypothetical protein